ncbi:hypothetical protein vBEcoD226_2 [Escherichia phage vB_Eco_D226]|uniref:HNH nuclease domain-containing protein n=2 Tax=Berlinvirus TaxID=2732677 RepID=A0A514A6S1_9CAUD|nr:hypothetical protein vBEcoD226_2 [Escherichia phage vB_Eco_D226]UEW68695.1 hypothetical protein vBSEqdws315_45 [Enterobacter phage vB_SEqdws-315]
MRVAIDSITGCHIFQGCKTKGGYGRIRVDGVHWMAHRYALSVHLKRPLKEGCVVMHSCDNPACVNPAHLSEGTQKENIEDCRTKGRMIRGGASGTRLSHAEKVQQAFDKRLNAVLSADGTDAEVAKKLGVNIQWVKKAREGKLNMHVK